MLRIMSAGHLVPRGDVASRVAEEGQRGNFPSPTDFILPKVMWPWWGFLSFFFFFFWWGFLNQSTLCRPQSRGSQRTVTQLSDWTAEITLYLSVSQDPFRKRNTLSIHFHVGHTKHKFQKRRSQHKRKESKWHNSKHSHRTEQGVSEDSGKETANEWNGPQGGNKNT